MTVWENCEFDLYQDNHSPSLRLSGYDVKIDNDEVVVSYEDDDGNVIYRGVNTGDGHYLLTAIEREGRATLHRFPNGDILEGNWHENGLRGMWRIYLDDENIQTAVIE